MLQVWIRPKRNFEKLEADFATVEKPYDESIDMRIAALLDSDKLNECYIFRRQKSWFKV